MSQWYWVICFSSLHSTREGCMGEACFSHPKPNDHPQILGEVARKRDQHYTSAYTTNMLSDYWSKGKWTGEKAEEARVHDRSYHRFHYLVWQGFHVYGRSHLPWNRARLGLPYRYFNLEDLLGKRIPAPGSEQYHKAGQKLRGGHAATAFPTKSLQEGDLTACYEGHT